MRAGPGRQSEVGPAGEGLPLASSPPDLDLHPTPVDPVEALHHEPSNLLVIGPDLLAHPDPHGLDRTGIGDRITRV